MFDKIMVLFASVGAMLRTLFFLVSLLIMIVYISYSVIVPSSDKNNDGQKEAILADHANTDFSNTPLAMTEQNQLSWSAVKGIGK